MSVFRTITISALFATFVTASGRVHAANAAIATPHELATNAAAKTLKLGGSAADAAIAAAFTLAIVMPSRTGLGGGGLALYYDKSANGVAEFDFLEAVPPEGLEALMSSLPGTDGMPPPVPAGKAAVPGFVAGLDKIHKRFGKLPWRDLFSDAIHFAGAGFTADKNLLGDLSRAPEEYLKDKRFRLIFADPLSAAKPLLQQESLSLTLEKLRDVGADDFYKGGLAKLIAKECTEGGISLNISDLEYYRVRVSTPSSYPFKDLRILLPGLPSYGPALLDQLLRGWRVNKPDRNGRAVFMEKQTGEFLKDHPLLRDLSALKSGYGASIAVADAQGNVAVMINTLHALFGSGKVLPASGILLGDAAQMPLMRALLGDKAGNADWDLRRRPAVYFTPLIVRRGFDEVTAIATDGGMTAPQNLFHLIIGNFVAKTAWPKVVKAPKIYGMPQESVNLYEEGVPAKQTQGKTAHPLKVSPYSIGAIQIVTVSAKGAKAFSDPRAGGKAAAVKTLESP